MIGRQTIAGVSGSDGFDGSVGCVDDGRSLASVIRVWHAATLNNTQGRCCRSKLVSAIRHWILLESF